jgi:hypothetical protein
MIFADFKTSISQVLQKPPLSCRQPTLSPPMNPEKNILPGSLWLTQSVRARPLPLLPPTMDDSD